MKKIFITSVLLIAYVSLFSQLVEKHNLQYKNANYDVAIFQIDSSLLNNFEIIENSSGKSEKDLFDSLSKKGTFFAVSAGIVDSACNLLGLFVNHANRISDINLNSGNGNFFLKPNGFIGFNSNEVAIKKSEDFNQSDNYNCAVQSGPMLLADNSINSQFDKNSKNKNFRIGAGVYSMNSKNYLLFIISNTTVTFYQFASVFKEKFNCKNALNLESGSFCSMHLPSFKKNYNDKKITCKYLYFRL